MEHRWGDRHSLETMVAVRAGGWRILARVRNMSLSGAYLQCTVPEVTAVRIQVFFNEGAGSGRVGAHIVRRTSEGIGIEWGEFAPVTVMRILNRAEHDRAGATIVPPAASALLAAAREGL